MYTLALSALRALLTLGCLEVTFQWFSLTQSIGAAILGIKWLQRKNLLTKCTICALAANQWTGVHIGTRAHFLDCSCLASR